MTTPQRPPQPPPQPEVTVKPGPRPKPVNVGITTILDHVSNTTRSTRGARTQLTPEHRKRLENVARLAKELRQELDALAELEPKEG